ncbi:MAG: cytochrome c [Deltaproteobacteria bacterium]|nr:cytochrome c [Deltaproteobacteria bacterium]
MKNTPRPGRRWILPASALGSIALALALLAVTAPPAQAQSAEGVPQFNRTCGRCHPDGNEDDGPDLHNKNLSVAAMTKVVREGTTSCGPSGRRSFSDADLARGDGLLRSIHAVRRPLALL